MGLHPSTTARRREPRGGGAAGLGPAAGAATTARAVPSAGCEQLPPWRAVPASAARVPQQRSVGGATQGCAYSVRGRDGHAAAAPPTYPQRQPRNTSRLHPRWRGRRLTSELEQARPAGRRTSPRRPNVILLVGAIRETSVGLDRWRIDPVRRSSPLSGNLAAGLDSISERSRWDVGPPPYVQTIPGHDLLPDLAVFKDQAMLKGVIGTGHSVAAEGPQSSEGLRRFAGTAVKRLRALNAGSGLATF